MLVLVKNSFWILRHSTGCWRRFFFFLLVITVIGLFGWFYAIYCGCWYAESIWL